MKPFRYTALALLLLFTGTVIAMQFHSHPAGQDQMAAHCKSCQVSHSSYDTVQSKELGDHHLLLHFAEFHKPAFYIEELQHIISNRAPPLA